MKSTVKISVLIFIFVAIGCKGEVDLSASKPKPVVQTSPADEEVAELEIDEYAKESDDTFDDTEELEDEEESDIGRNSPPVIVSLKLSPRVVYPGTTVSVLVEGRDAEEEEIEFYYRWHVNGEFLADEEQDELDTTGFNKEDLVTAFVTPFDGEITGKEVMSPSLLISNRPPEITSAPIGSIVDGVFIYEVEASDPDGDELKFSLESAPAGMKIDSSSGKVDWEIPFDAKGPFTIKVVVSDGSAITFQGFTIGEITRELR